MFTISARYLLIFSGCQNHFLSTLIWETDTLKKLYINVSSVGVGSLNGRDELNLPFLKPGFNSKADEIRISSAGT